MEHTKEQWYVGAQNDLIYIVAGRRPALNNDYPVHDADRTLIARMKGDNYGMDSTNARRIVACVNACNGVSNTQLSEIMNDYAGFAALMEEHEELEKELEKQRRLGQKSFDAGRYGGGDIYAPTDDEVIDRLYAQLVDMTKQRDELLSVLNAVRIDSVRIGDNINAISNEVIINVDTVVSKYMENQPIKE